MKDVSLIINNTLVVKNEGICKFKTDISQVSRYIVQRVITNNFMLTYNDTRDELGIDIHMVAIKISNILIIDR